MREALGALVFGVVAALCGYALRRSASVATQTVGEVAVYGGAIVAAVGTFLLVARIRESRDR